MMTSLQALSLDAAPQDAAPSGPADNDSEMLPDLIVESETESDMIENIEPLSNVCTFKAQPPIYPLFPSPANLLTDLLTPVRPIIIP